MNLSKHNYYSSVLYYFHFSLISLAHVQNVPIVSGTKAISRSSLVVYGLGFYTSIGRPERWAKTEAKRGDKH